MEIGDTLKKAREEQGITLEVVEEHTKIRKKYLDALEKEEFDVLPGNIYVRGFLRNYARFLGINGESLIKQYSNYYEQEDEQEDNLPDLSDKSTFFSKKILIICLLICLAAGAAVVYFGFIAKNSVKVENKQEEVKQQQDNYVANTPKEKNEQSPGNVEEKKDEVCVELNVTGKSWARVVVDDKEVFEGNLYSGDKKEFTGKNKIYFCVGNAGSVYLTVNDESKGCLGEEGHVEKKTYYVKNKQ
ncbi:MAG: DUF4115 domain-containing protein [Clostridiales bacterium]|nr:DUF4115 domain-containing protein [Clostridiales bacterium]MCF8023413.1 DUF4115 domain-containing protein [Clostridiales bacterium]